MARRMGKLMRHSGLYSVQKMRSRLAIIHCRDNMTDARLRSAEKAGQWIGVDFSHQIADVLT